MRPTGFRDGWFVDDHGRRLLLRGVNLGGSSKVPSAPDGSTHISENFFDHRDVRFTTRPFPLDAADEHFSRIRRWGFRIVRLVVPWEAIEHGGPGLYDEAYLDHVAGICNAARRHDIGIIVDPHQDAWSRHCGGDGAPGWTLEAAGFELRAFDETGAAVRHQTLGDPFPRMIWSTNVSKLAAATMFTLFFGGDDFAPSTLIEGEPAQSFLQRHYCDSFAKLAARLHALDNIIGFDTMNEPPPGLIGLEDMTRHAREPRIGAMPTPIEAIALGDGYPQRVGVYRLTAAGSIRTSRRILNPAGVRAWMPGVACIWREHGVWEPSLSGRPIARKPDYFAEVRGRRVDFTQDYLVPFIRRFSVAIEDAKPGSLFFVESSPWLPVPRLEDPLARRAVPAPHWYDGLVLMLGSFHSWLGADYRYLRPVFGRRRIRKNYADQLRHLGREGARHIPGAPALIGEIGVPFENVAHGRVRRRHGRATAAMDRSLTALDDALLSYTLWNYTADNTAERGDGWNGENLSIYAPWAVEDPREPGGRALAAVIRPYPLATAGVPRRLEFDYQTGRFVYEFDFVPADGVAPRAQSLVEDPVADTMRDVVATETVAGGDSVAATTEIFVPNFHYANGITVQVTGGSWEYDRASELLRHTAGGTEPGRTVRYRIEVRKSR